MNKHDASAAGGKKAATPKGPSARQMKKARKRTESETKATSAGGPPPTQLWDTLLPMLPMLLLLMKLVVSGCSWVAKNHLRNPSKLWFSEDPEFRRILEKQAKSRNASREVDFLATLVGILLIVVFFDGISRRLSTSLILSAEESASDDMLAFLGRWVGGARDVVRNASDFYRLLKSSGLAFCLDAVDGTAVATCTGFGASLTLYVQGVARIVVLAVEPEGVIVEAVLPGPAGREVDGARVFRTDRSGNQVDLVERFKSQTAKQSLKEAKVLYHISRSKNDQGQYRSDRFIPALAKLVKNSGTTLSYGSGAVAVEKVLSGEAAACVFQAMPAHDRAAIAPLVAAVTGDADAVCDFSGNAIPLEPRRVDLIAGSQKVLPGLLSLFRGAGPRRTRP